MSFLADAVNDDIITSSSMNMSSGDFSFFGAGNSTMLPSLPPLPNLPSQQHNQQHQMPLTSGYQFHHRGYSSSIHQTINMNNMNSHMNFYNQIIGHHSHQINNQATSNNHIENNTAKIEIFHGKASFPLNLALMLEHVERLGLSHIVSWLPCGLCFVIQYVEGLLEEVLPIFFKSSPTKARSFYRKLNRWGFNVQAPTRKKAAASKVARVMTAPSKDQTWYSPDFSRCKAVACLTKAFDTGDMESAISMICHGDKKKIAIPTFSVKKSPTDASTVTFSNASSSSISCQPATQRVSCTQLPAEEEQPLAHHEVSGEAVSNVLTQAEDVELSEFFARYALTVGDGEPKDDCELIPFR